ncbi:unannotated protein [freshwater metagenome]|uniref:Unannotated protein n=1 Tax=freshwater metagenome TaxID=449393 RepID=A0A6J7M8D9_9ZZZZ|nr:hypothetical protein [Actinomycetota bacterium]MSX89963.1 hypothetical protein [Actinomycetota bacterium]MSZ64639.1 hypothetical protein [Actinomycetota bacterium]MTA58184.1 hypothetical protein [Actinomycetota bacterium]
MSLNIQEIALAYEKATQEFLDIAMSVPTDKLDLHVGEDWSSRQVIHHCADSEAQSYARLRRLIAEPGSTIQGYDEGKWAEDLTLGYRQLPVADSIDVVRAVRAGSLAIIKRLQPAQLENFGVHSQSGRFTVERWLEIYTRHAVEHAEQITKNLKL